MSCRVEVSSGSTIASAVRPLFSMISLAATRPAPLLRGNRRCETIPRSDPASERRTCCCSCGGKKVNDAVDGLLRVDGVQRRHDKMPRLSRLEGGAHGVDITHLTHQNRSEERREGTAG